MNNDPQLNGKFLGTITSDFVKVADNLQEAAYQIRKKGFSDFPVFPMSKTDLPIGQLLYGQGDLENDWNYYATYIDEFVQRQIVEVEKLDDFKKKYKNPDEFCCLFVVDGDFASFIYVPYPEDQ